MMSDVLVRGHGWATRRAVAAVGCNRRHLSLLVRRQASGQSHPSHPVLAPLMTVAVQAHNNVLGQSAQRRANMCAPALASCVVCGCL